MLNQSEIMQTIQMIDQQHLDVRTITMGISLLSCAHSDTKVACDKVYDKITSYAENLVATGEGIEKEFGIPIVNKRISVTPIALVAAASETDNYTPFAQAMDRAAKTTGVNFIGGFSALVQKGMTKADRILINSIPEALSTTDIVCSSVNVGSTKAGIDMDAVALMGRTIKNLAQITPSWPALSTEWASRKRSSTWASPARAWCTTPCKLSRDSPLTWWPRPSRRPLSALPAWASWWPRRPPAAWIPPLALWI